MNSLRIMAKQSFDPLVSVDIPPAIKAFRELRTQVQIPIEHPIDLLKGMSMDLCEQRYPSLGDLEIYCYRVAGVVGVMMSHIMGIKDQKAYRHAIDLGLAMQLTNICRDVVTDAKIGRVYLPELWLVDAQIEPTPEALLNPKNHPEVVSIVKLLLERADSLYASGDKGLKYLPLRCALAVSIAREVYAAIGDEVLRRGVHAWDHRVWIPLPRKIFLGFKGIMKALGTIPYRLRKHKVR
ncbi:MAG: phytoene/squalene synthase family protein, partial [Proteobacteria bacterium]